MDFTLTPEQLSLQQAVRKFAQRELPEIAQQIESNDEPRTTHCGSDSANWATLASISIALWAGAA